MGLSKALLSVFLLVLSVKAYGYADSAEALLSLQAKINETITADRTFYPCESDFGNASFYEKQFLKKKDYHLPRLETSDYETTHYVFRARLGEKPSINYSYKQGTYGYYQAIAKGNCTALSAVEFEAALKQRIGR